MTDVVAVLAEAEWLLGEAWWLSEWLLGEARWAAEDLRAAVSDGQPPAGVWPLPWETPW